MPQRDFYSSVAVDLTGLFMDFLNSLNQKQFFSVFLDMRSSLFVKCARQYIQTSAHYLYRIPFPICIDDPIQSFSRPHLFRSSRNFLSKCPPFPVGQSFTYPFLVSTTVARASYFGIQHRPSLCIVEPTSLSAFRFWVCFPAMPPLLLPLPGDALRPSFARLRDTSSFQLFLPYSIIPPVAFILPQEVFFSLFALFGVSSAGTVFLF